MKDSDSKLPATDTSVSVGLVVFYDEFVEFQAYCAFLCDALSSMAAAQIELDDATRRGVSAFAGDLKYRVEALRILLQRLQEKSCADDNNIA